MLLGPHMLYYKNSALHVSFGKNTQQPSRLPHRHQGLYSLSLFERCGSLLMTAARRRQHMLQVTATLCTAVSLPGEVRLRSLWEQPQGSQRSPHSAPQWPALHPTVTLLRWEGHKWRERAVIVFQFNQLHCDRSLSTGSVMLPLPSSILTLTPFEMWAVLNCRMGTRADC